MIDGIKYVDDDEFVVSLDTLVDLLEAKIIVLRTEGSKLGDSIDRAYVAHNATSYAIAESIVAGIIDRDNLDITSMSADLFN